MMTKLRKAAAAASVVVPTLLRQMNPEAPLPALPTAAQVTALPHTYRPAAFVVHAEFRNQPAHTLLWQLLRGRGYQETQVGASCR